ncbi:DNA mismatch repair protein MSH3 [Mycena rebaudengoi]|nr:DNA mismatch repair protein MSH3 [Mycena rebaudengoi]
MSSTPLSSPSRQSRISNFFSQSPKQHKRAVSPGGILNEPPKKKKRTGQHTTGTVVGPSREQTVPAEVLARREEFKKKLLLDNNPLLRRAHQRETTEAQDTEPIVVSDSDSDHAFQEMTALFASKTGEGNKKSAQRAKKSKALELGPSGKTYTPLEKQYMNLKQANPDVLLMVQVGYKYKFFGDDAKVAAKELGMACFQDRNFLAASIPEHRRDIHLKKYLMSSMWIRSQLTLLRLLCQGYKVGIVQQVETAALKKAGDNKNTVFDRKLVKLFTAATQVHIPSVVCVIEEKSEKTAGAHVCIGMVSVSPGTGEVVWDAFDDNPMRIELEPSGLSKFTEKMISHFSGYFIIVSTESKIRTEHLNETMSFSDAFDFVVTFYSAGKADSDLKDDQRLAALPGFPKFVVVALAHVISYLSDFDIAGPLSTAVFNKFTSSSHMLLAGNTLANLEIFRKRNRLDWPFPRRCHPTHYKLTVGFWTRPTPAFGARMLKTWISKPLIDKCALQERIDAVEEILNSPSDKLHSLRDLLKRLPDLEKGLVRIQYKQANPQELTVLLSAFYKIGSAFTADTVSNPSFKSRLLNEIIASLPPLNQPMKMLKDAIHSKQAAEGRKDIMWTDPTKFPVIEDNILAIRAVEMELDEELKKIRKTLKYPSLKWTTVGGEEYLIEVKKSDKRPIPDSYHPAISKTKYAERYRSPEVKQKLQERARWNESLQVPFLFSLGLVEIDNEVGLHYAIMRNAVNKLAVADCLMSFAQVALRENYVKPEFTEEPILEIVDGRHPMVEALRSDPFVANSVYMGGEEATSKIITGPNMEVRGGKSSCVRMVALLVIMAQIGSYVPATSVKLGNSGIFPPFIKFSAEDIQECMTKSSREWERTTTSFGVALRSWSK